MTVPSPPRGAVAAQPRQLLADRGEVARWRHTDRLPALELSLRAAGKHGGYPEQPAHVLVSPHPVRMEGITDPAELRQIAWCLLAAAAWLERQHPAQPEPAEPAEPDPQMTVFDFVEATP